MEATFISVAFMLVFWGGLVFFLGEAVILSFRKAQELLLQRISVFYHYEYYRRSFFGKLSRIFVFSDLRTKIVLCLLICTYTVLSVELMSVADSSLSVLEKMLQTIAVSHH